MSDGTSARRWGIILSIVVVAVTVLLLVGAGPALGEYTKASVPTGGPTPFADDEPTSAIGDRSVSIDDSLEQRARTVDVLVTFEDRDPPESAASGETIGSLQRSATRSQQPLEEYADRTDGIAIERTFWIVNAALVTVDTSDVTLGELASVEGIVGLRNNTEILGLESRVQPHEGGPFGTVSSGEHTYGLNQLEVPSVWSQYGVRGEGATVAVLDTGVDATHPDIDIDGWKDFNGDPSETPIDYESHGTHVSGTVAGGDAGGTHIGVAPESRLLHGAVLTNCENDICTGQEDQIIAGMEWAVEEGADIISLSLGTEEYQPLFIEAVRNAEAAGTLVTAAAGNDRDGSSFSPANVYESLSVAAADEDGEIATFSGGETIETGDVWGTDAPDDWPDEYVVPDVAAPGVAVESAEPGGGYRLRDGTSMATPHVAGVAALMESATDRNLTPAEMRDGLVTSAWKPAGEPTDQDTRYGHGIIDAADAVEHVSTRSTLTGTVTDETTGTPIQNASLQIESMESEPTDLTTDDGNYTIESLRGDVAYTVTVDAPGYTTTEETVTIEPDTTTSLDLTLAGEGTVNVTVTDSHFDEPIDDASVAIDGTWGTYPAERKQDGRFVAENVPTGKDYVVTAEASGYEPTQREIELADAEPVETAFGLQGNAVIELDVVDAVTESAIADATIRIERSDGRAFETDKRTAEDGTLAIAVPGTGTDYAMAGQADGYSAETAQSDPESGETDAVTLAMPGDSSVTLSITDEHFGTDIETATVAIDGEQGTYPGSIEYDGLFVVESVPSLGDYHVTVGSPGYRDYEEDVRIDTTQQTEHPVTLRGDATISLSVVDERTDRPIGAARVRVEDPDGNAFDVAEPTPEDGSLTIAVPGAATAYTIESDAEGYESVTERVMPASGETIDSTVSMRGDSRTTVTLVDDHFDTTIDEATVEVVGPQGTYVATSTDGGAFVAPAVATRGQYAVVIDAPGYMPHEETITPASGSETDIGASLTGDASVTIRVADVETDDPIADVRVTVERADGSTFEPPDRTADDGQLEVVVPGTDEPYTVSANHPDFAENVTTTSVVASGSTQSVQVRMEPAADDMPGLTVPAVVVALVLTLAVRRRLA